MKKLAFSGMVILIVLFLGTCAGPTGPGGSDEIEYTDVVYSEDGSQITMYLDGTKVPVSKSQRTISLGLAKMSHDYFEAVFVHRTAATSPVSPTYTIARTTWEIGQSAGVTGVLRGAAIDYSPVALLPPTDDGGGNDVYTVGAASIVMVGRKSDKTLLGVGKLVKINGSSFATNSGFIDSNTTSVTFEVGSIVAGVPTSMSGLTQTLTNLSGTDYPMYYLDPSTTTTTATYTIGVANGNGVYVETAPSSPQGTAGSARVYKRDPRYVAGTRTFYANQSRIDSDTSVVFTATLAANSPFGLSQSLGLSFASGVKGGIFSFFIEIPVYGITRLNNSPPTIQPDYTTWWIRTGYGQNLYNLDNGTDNSGCVLMGVGIKDLDWIEIFTEGL